MTILTDLIAQYQEQNKKDPTVLLLNESNNLSLSTDCIIDVVVGQENVRVIDKTKKMVDLIVVRLQTKKDNSLKPDEMKLL